LWVIESDTTRLLVSYHTIKVKGKIDVVLPMPALLNLLPWKDHGGAFMD
jgi:hypothetical protein